MVCDGNLRRLRLHRASRCSKLLHEVDFEDVDLLVEACIVRTDRKDAVKSKVFAG